MEVYNNDTEHFDINELKWIGIYTLIGLVIAAVRYLLSYYCIGSFHSE